MRLSVLLAGSMMITLAASSGTQAASCKKDYSTCEQVVRTWCDGGHPGADRDGDGIPCENMCRTKSEVDEIRRRIGCRR